MPMLDTLEKSTTHRVVLFGPPKSGKTLLAGKLASHFNLLWFDCENGWSTLTALPPEYRSKIDIVPIPDSRVYPIASETWLKIIRGGPLKLCLKHGKVDCALCKRDSLPFQDVHLNALSSDTIVVFDSLTQFSNSCLANLTKDKPEDYKTQLDDWGNLRVLIDKFLSQVQVAPYNVVCITHEEQIPLEDGRVKLVPVCGSSKSSQNTAKYFDHVIYCEIKNKKHSAASSSTYAGNVVTGSRTSVTLEKDSEPSLLSIFKPSALTPTNTQGTTNNGQAKTTNTTTAGKPELLSKLRNLQNPTPSSGKST